MADDSANFSAQQAAANQRVQALKAEEDAQKKLNALKDEAAQKQEEYNELLKIAQSLSGNFAKMDERTNKLLEERQGFAKRNLQQDLAQVAAAKDEAEQQRLLANYEKELAVLKSGGGAGSAKANVRRQEELELLMDSLKLEQDKGKLAAKGLSGSEQDIEKLKRRNAYYEAAIGLSSAELEIMEKKAELAGEIDKHAQNMINNIMASINATGGIFEKIPLIGGAIKDKFDEVSETLKSKLVDAAAQFKQKFAENLAAGQSSMTAMRNSVASIGPAMQAAFAAAGPILFLAALAIGIKRADEMEQATIDLQKSMGGTKDQAAALTNELKKSEAVVKGVGGSMEDVIKAATTLRTEISPLENITSGVVSTVVALDKQFGISNESAAKVIDTFQNIGGLTLQGAAGALMMTTQMAKLAGLDASVVVEDIKSAASSGDDLFNVVRGGAKELAKMAVETRLMGSNLASAVKASKTLLDFEKNITDELEASAILGVDINLQKARELAFNGDLVGSQKEIMNQLNKIGDINKLSLYEKEALAQATGMEVGELAKLQRIQRQFPGIEKEKMDAAMKLADQYGDLSNITDEMLNSEVERQSKEEAMRTTLQQMSDAFHEIGVQFAEVLLPLGQAFLLLMQYTLLPALRLIGTIIHFIADGFKSLIAVFTGGEAPLSGWARVFGIMAAILTLIIARTIIWRGVTMAVQGAAMALRLVYLGILALKSGFTGLGAMFSGGFWSNALTSAKGFFNNLGNMIKGVPKTPPIAPTTPNIPGGGGTPSVAPTTTPGGGTESVSKGAKAINPATVLAAAAAMIAFAVAIYILAKAFQEFDQIKDMGKVLLLFGAAVLGMVAVLGVAALGASALQPILWPLVGVLLAFGAAVALVGVGIKLMSDGVSLLMRTFAEVGPKIVTPMGQLIGMLPQIGLLALAFFGLAASLSAVGLAGMLALPTLMGIAAVGAGVAGIVTALSPVKKEEKGLATETVATKEEGITETIQVMMQPLLEQIVGLRQDLNSGKVAVYLDGVKVMRELKGVDTRELVTDRPRK